MSCDVFRNFATRGATETCRHREQQQHTHRIRQRLRHEVSLAAAVSQNSNGHRKLSAIMFSQPGMNPGRKYLKNGCCDWPLSKIANIGLRARTHAPVQTHPLATRPPRRPPAAADPQPCGARIDWAPSRASPNRFLSNRPGSCRSWFA